MKTIKKDSCCIVTIPISKAGIPALQNLIDILHPFIPELYVVTGNDGYDYLQKDKIVTSFCVNHTKGSNIITQVLMYVWVQLRISLLVVQIRHRTGIYLFFTGSEGLILPILTAKFLNKKVILAPVDYTIHFNKDGLSRILTGLTFITKLLSDIIVVPSEEIVNNTDLRNYRSKIIIGQEHFLNLENFKYKLPFSKRKNLVGYVGRFSEEKGVLNFFKAIPIVSKTEDIEYLVGGDGDLKADIEQFIQDNNLENRVSLVGWIPHEKISDFLNELRLLVIPSYTETGPLIAFEAMACGTPVLSTNVGSIPKVVEDGETGFILPSNSPECIAQGIERALNYPDLQRIVDSGQKIIENEFNYEMAVGRYKKILERI
jgi:glycosyltransferase involved in cell wall biosynthesis